MILSLEPSIWERDVKTVKKVCTVFEFSPFFLPLTAVYPRQLKEALKKFKAFVNAGKNEV
jgi:hypothetical protein